MIRSALGWRWRTVIGRHLVFCLIMAVAACSTSGGQDEGTSTAALSSNSGARATGTRPVGNLVGLNERQLADTLGAPSFRRTDGPNELIQYRTTECILDVFLYPNASGELIAAYVEARNTALAVVDAANCAGKVASLRKH